MKFFTNLSDTTKGILLIAAGVILLLHITGIGGQTINTIVLLTTLGLIALGLYIAKAHQKIYKLLAKEKRVEIEEENESSTEEKQDH